jgi:hypothetical protein
MEIWNFDPVVAANTCGCPLAMCERDTTEGENLCPLCREMCVGATSADTVPTTPRSV